MNIGIFGGTFDPIHRGHIALARAAQERCQLHAIYFVPADVPPHKQRQPITSYFHRYAMVTLATREDKAFIPSQLEAPAEPAAETGKKSKSSPPTHPANYSIDTIRRLKQILPARDHLFFLIGIDAFEDIAKWHEAEALFAECDFVVASRPGFSLSDVANALPEKLRPRDSVTRPFVKQPATGDLVLPGVRIHLLDNVHQNVSASGIRAAVVAKRSLNRFLDPAVAEYIRKTGLYKARA